MGTTSSMDTESLAFFGGLVSMIGGMALTMAVVAVIVWLVSRAVNVIPREHHRFNTGRLWTFYGVWVFLNIGLIILAVATYDADGGDGSDWQYSVAQLLVQAYMTGCIFWVMLKVPAAFSAAFATYSPEVVPPGDHGRLAGLSYAILSLVSLVFLLIASFAMGQGNPLTMLRNQLSVQQESDSPLAMQPGEIAMACGSGILGIVSLVLLIIFVVMISKSRGALLKLQHEAENPAPSVPPSAPIAG